MIRVLVFDLGGVLSMPPDLYSEPAALLGVDPAAYEAVYNNGRADYDLGTPSEEYFGGILANLAITPSAALFAHLGNLDTSLWCRLRPTARALLDEVSGWDQRLAILSNAPITLRACAERTDWYPLLERLFVSAELRLAKPDHRIYHHATAELGVAPDEIAFIDDRPENVAGATDVGWNAHLWVDDADSLAWLRQVCGR